MSVAAEAEPAQCVVGVIQPGQVLIELHCDMVTALQTGYEQWLRDRLGRVGAKILPLPQISHHEILSRALPEERPFRIKGDGPKMGSDGYRDMLIWASVAEYSAAHLGASDTLILVTDNHTDFCDVKDMATVAGVLRADLGNDAPAVQRLARLSDLAGLLPVQPQDAAEIKRKTTSRPRERSGQDSRRQSSRSARPWPAGRSRTCTGMSGSELAWTSTSSVSR